MPEDGTVNTREGVKTIGTDTVGRTDVRAKEAEKLIGTDKVGRTNMRAKAVIGSATRAAAMTGTGNTTGMTGGSTAEETTAGAYSVRYPVFRKAKKYNKTCSARSKAT